MAKAKKTTPASKKSTSAKLNIDLEEIKKAYRALRAVDHELRQDMLNLIHTNKEIKVTDIYQKLRIEQSKTSAFLALLRKSGVVRTRREGQIIYYSINYEHLSAIEKGAKIING
jgi:DNA-binding transcriptional ArsR family regulator